MLKKTSTHFLRAAVIFMALAVLAFCVFALPVVWQTGPKAFPGAEYAVFIIVAAMYLAALPFYALLWETLKLLRYIDESKAFSDLSIRALRNIKRYAASIAVLYVAGVPFLYPIAQSDDAPGLIIIGMVAACAPIVVAVFAAVLEKLLRSGMDLKSENDLTV